MINLKEFTNGLNNINNEIIENYEINYKKIYNNIISLVKKNNLFKKYNNEFIDCNGFNYRITSENYTKKNCIKSLCSIIGYILDKLKILTNNNYGKDEIFNLLEVIKNFTFLIYPYGRNSNYFKEQAGDFFIDEKEYLEKQLKRKLRDNIIFGSNIPIKLSIQESFNNRQNIMISIFKTYFCFDLNKGVDFYKIYKNIYSFSPTNLFNAIFKQNEAYNLLKSKDISIKNLEYIIYELRSDSSYFNELVIKNLKSTFYALQQKCREFITYDIDKAFENIPNKTLIDEQKQIITILNDLSKKEFFEEDENYIENIEKYLQKNFNKYLQEDLDKEFNTLFSTFIYKCCDIQESLYLNKLINDEIYELIYSLYREFIRIIRNQDKTFATSIESCVSFLEEKYDDILKSISLKAETIPEEEKIRLFNSFCNNARKYYKDNKINYYCDSDGNKLINENLKSQIYKIYFTNGELIKFVNQYNIIYDVICASQKYLEDLKNNVSILYVTDYANLFIIPIKIVERYLKTILVKKYRNRIKNIKNKCNEIYDIEFIENGELNYEDLSHKTEKCTTNNNILELGSVSLAIQYVLNNSNPNKYTVFTGMYNPFRRENGNKIIEYSGIYNNTNKINPLQKSTTSMPFQEFISFIRNGYMHSDIVEDINEAEDIYNAVCYWLVKCIDDCNR